MSEFVVAEEADEKCELPPMETIDLVDLDTAPTSDSWNFYSAAAFFSNPPSPLLLSPSLPSRSLSHLAVSFPQPTSPLWIFDDETAEIAGNFDSEKENDNLQIEKIRTFPRTPIKEVSDISYLIKERMKQALRYFKEWTNQRVLVQVWVPVRNGDRYVLTTSEQPFELDRDTNGLLQYRNVSLMYLFSVDENNDAALGLPGRVFKLKKPEWTPNVQYYSNKEYPRLSHALLYNIRGSLGLPVFDPSRQSCVGVIELIMTSEMVNYAPEVDKVCRALEAVNLKSSEILEHQSIQACDKEHRAALAELLQILTIVCEAQKLPLAQTWVPCQHGTVLAQHDGSRKSISTSNGICMGQVCMSTTDAAFYVVEAQMWGFRVACSEHHLQKGQGVVGRAFSVKRPCFCRDVTKFCKMEYPLVHYAQMFGLGSCFALCFGSSHSGDDIYVVEFFLPSDCKDPIKQDALLESISTLVKHSLRSLKVITGAEVEGLPLGKIDMITYANNEMKQIQYALPKLNTLEDFDEHENKRIAEHNSPEQHLELSINSEKNTTLPGKGSITAPAIITNKVAGRKRGKTEKIISLEILQQYFAGSLKDAAKSLGVCPTTMKRICRQHGISRWPSRKINKVNRSISKLKQVIESVQVAEVALNLNPLVCPLPVAPGSISFPVHSDSDSIARDEGTPHFKALEEPVGGHTSSNTKSSSDGDLKTPVSQGSNDASLGREACGIEKPFSRNSKQFVSAKDQNTVALFSPANIIVEPEHAVADILVEDSASSKLARNTPSTAISEPKTVIIKACYKEDIIRFRLAYEAGIVALNEEIGKRLMLEIGTFVIKYLDDDYDWVKLSCEEDLQECLEISAMSGSSVIRLSIQDVCNER
ncbi:protein NLP3 isoform X1 [Dendrobium catenatum]|uniref:protein NLP3 isoform X1 n=1 Tax=Dendrobium catenatum TaxID=906689 RepID=UPI0009F2D82E|nr:protein NLP3 isoform X1 [Dendrobium catenatum]